MPKNPLLKRGGGVFGGVFGVFWECVYLAWVWVCVFRVCGCVGVWGFAGLGRAGIWGDQLRLGGGFRVAGCGGVRGVCGCVGFACVMVWRCGDDGGGVSGPGVTWGP